MDRNDAAKRTTSLADKSLVMGSLKSGTRAQWPQRERERSCEKTSPKFSLAQQAEVSSATLDFHHTRPSHPLNTYAS
eukprot:6191868-Pleurochrysis_carterae.AAC.2